MALWSADNLTLSQLDKEILESETAKKIDGLCHAIFQIVLDYVEQIAEDRHNVQDKDWLKIQNLMTQSASHILDLITKMRHELGEAQRIYAGTGERLE